MMTNTTSTDNTDHDAELVARSLTGNRDAFGLIVSRYQSLVCSIAYSATGCLSRSEDLAQETFLTAWKQLTHDFAIGGNVIARHANDAVARELFERFHAAGIFQALLFAVTALSLGPVGWLAWRTRKQAKATAVLLCAALIPLTARPQTDTKDWPMYNRDLLGTRHNKGETVIGPANSWKSGDSLPKDRLRKSASSTPHPLS
jgi:hypothetical protein